LNPWHDRNNIAMQLHRCFLSFCVPHASWLTRTVYELNQIIISACPFKPICLQDKNIVLQDETDYLLDMCKRLDLRFIVIADRWAFPGGPHRSVEDLKERYYDMATELLVHREGTRELVANNAIVRQRYDAQSERERKALLQMTLTRSQQQVFSPSWCSAHTIKVAESWKCNECSHHHRFVKIQRLVPIEDQFSFNSPGDLSTPAMSRDVLCARVSGRPCSRRRSLARSSRFGFDTHASTSSGRHAPVYVQQSMCVPV
jgi:hypothetical protein